MMNNNVFEKKTNGICEKIKEVFAILCNNSMIVSKDTEIFRMPLIVFAIIALFNLHISIPVILITLFCGVEYTFSGEDFATSPKVSFR